MADNTDRMILEGTMPGHWSTAEGAEMANTYAGKRREDLAYGGKTDLELANAIFMVGRGDLELIGLQTAAKERIRWLSAQLALALRSSVKTVDADAPDRLWLSSADEEGEHAVWFEPDEGGAQYIRADLSAIEAPAAEGEAVRIPDDTGPGWTYLTAGDFRRARQALGDHNG